DQIPGLLTQGTDILSDDFTLEFFLTRINKKRSQARVFIMDQTVISSIGNAYADEILFDAKIHPKTPCNKLDDEEKNRLYESICRVMRLGIKKIEESGQPIEVKIRDHMKVRNRKDTPCPECGTTIRRASVHGYDTFFCPQCQPVKGKSAIPW
ncbi:MAG: DNA-formamidopyrimidine glycosylase, partial [bacterium]|nr:DNA-formamidopyrimidine glycosylase [bacterium]